MDTGLDFDAIRADLDAAEWLPDPDARDQEIRSVFLGTVFTLTPSGKYYAPFACGNVSEEEAAEDEAWREAAETGLEAIGAFLASGEGAPCDMFAQEVRDACTCGADGGTDAPWHQATCLTRQT